LHKEVVTATKKSNVSVKLDGILAEQMDAYVSQYGADKSKVIRMALENFFQQKSPVNKKTGKV
jgi:metal-responsive CopG/Arc/MetJ family transcriptional regulator